MFTRKFILIITICNLNFCCKSINVSNSISNQNTNQQILVKEIIENIASHCNSLNAEVIKSIEIDFQSTRTSIESGKNFKKLLLPASNKLSNIKSKNFKSYLDLMCHNDNNCKEILFEYVATYNLVHELFHILNSERYKMKIPQSYVKHPKKKQYRMSFDEEMKAELALVTYMKMQEKSKAKTYFELFSDILEQHNFKVDKSQIEKKWNNFEFDFMGINLSKVFFYIHAYKIESNSTLEESLFLSTN